MHLPNEDSFSADLGSIFTSTAKSNLKSQDFNYTLCPSCLQDGKESVLADFQINFEEAIRLCPVATCPYPLKEDNVVESFVFKRDASVLPVASEQNLPASSRKSRKSSGYSTFFEEFDLDTLLDFSTPTFQNQSMQIVNDVKKDIIINKIESDIKNDAIEMDINPHENFPINAPDMQADVENTCDNNTKLTSNNNVISVPGSTEIGESDIQFDNEFDPVMDIDTVTGTSDDDSVEVMIYSSQTNTEYTVKPEDEEEQLDIVEKLSRPPVHGELLQWINEQNSCWLDAILQILVSSVNTRASLNLSKSADKSVLKRIIMTYDVCQQAYQIHQTNNGNNDDAVVISLCQKLGRVRQDLLELLKRNTSFEIGEFQSLFEMLPLVLKTSEATADLFKVNMIWEFQCENCGHRRARRSHNHILSFPKVCSDFHPLNARFQRNCFECNSPSGETSILMEHLPACLAFHFQKGLPHSNLRVLDFAIQGYLYCVFAIVRYVLSPFKHFITWIRDIKANKWLCFDDLKSPSCKWQSRQPKIPAGEIHMVFWERQSVTDPLNTDKSQLSTVVNEETVAIADEMPIEIFFAHEDDETIVVPEYDNSNSPITTTNHCHNTVIEKCNNTVQSTSAEPMSRSAQQHHMGNMFGGKPQMIYPHPVNETPLQFHPQILPNGGISVVPDKSQQMIQVIAPANTCSIYIVTDGCKNHQMLHQGTPRPVVSNAIAKRHSVKSFVDNSHSYGMVSRTYSSTKKFSSYPQKRQYRLSGYSSFKEKHRFSPMKPTLSKTTQLTKEYLTASHPQCPEKEPNDEKLSEVSDLSDLLPDFDLDSNHSINSYSSAPAALRCSTVTPPLSLADSNSTPTNSPSGMNG
uniref:SUMO-specific isopeptidase USPL1-like n=1 Tax=Styela clava TaxID=7725 RepID=UPI00193A4955|nr:SUMO-specific isopeptidase USPL1-like [Styela clava]XP_039250747.1 SUMO-specific isopeptidase USPL1-like [Styela clava]